MRLNYLLVLCIGALTNKAVSAKVLNFLMVNDLHLDPDYSAGKMAETSIKHELSPLAEEALDHLVETVGQKAQRIQRKYEELIAAGGTYKELEDYERSLLGTQQIKDYIDKDSALY